MVQKQSGIPKLLSRRRVLLVTLLCVGLTAFLFWRELSGSELSFEGLQFGPKTILFLLLAFLMMGFRDLAYMLRIRLLTDKLLSWRQSFRVIMLWEFASALSPGVVGGSAVAMFIMQREDVPLGKSTALVLVTAIFDNLFYITAIPMVLALVGIAPLFPETMDWLEGGGIRLFWIGYLILVFVTLLLIIAVFVAPSAIAGLAISIFRRKWLRRYFDRAVIFGRDLKHASKELRGKSFLFWIKVFLATIWSWSSRFLVINFLLLAFIEMGVMDNLLLLGRQLLMWLVMLITPTPGGTGMAEYLFSEFFIDFIKNGGAAISLALLWRLVSYYPYLIIGTILFPRWIRKTADSKKDVA